MVSSSLEGKRESSLLLWSESTIGKMPVIGSTGVTPTFKDGGASLVDCLDVMLEG